MEEGSAQGADGVESGTAVVPPAPQVVADSSNSDNSTDVGSENSSDASGVKDLLSSTDLLSSVTSIFTALPGFQSESDEVNKCQEPQTVGATSATTQEKELQDDDEDDEEIDLNDYYSYSVSNKAQELVENAPRLVNAGRRGQKHTTHKNNQATAPERSSQ